ncbi:hypothetical protein ACGFIK_00890 [Micromonospora sp. NPDC048871]|uniref:hypothetical protein n=1 Tax=unclassified Micromonospora TaxID=2617518 RepID=UPI002E0F93CD|nr:glutamate-rich protein 5 [Micromonospora sp. NBC_01739]
MLRTASPVTVALGLLGATVTVTGAVLAAPVPQPASAASTVAVTGRAAAPSTVLPAALGAPLTKAGKKQCTVTDSRLREMSGLVATRNGYIVINDSTDQDDRKRVFYLNKDCQVVRDVGYSGAGPFDTEDLAISPDKKKLWIADTGDNVTSRQRRERVAVWSMPVNGSEQPKLHRLAYPDGKPRDAEALLIGDDNLPLIITKVTAGKAEIFTPDGALKTGDTAPVPMKKLGDITLPKTDTENPLSTFGRVAITGAARSPDGARVVLRTYADAFEYDVQNGDLVGALTNGTPRVTALADPFGEAISYSTDGKTFLTVSDAGHLDDDEPVDILSYTPSTEGPKNLAEDPDAAKKSTGQSFLDGLTLDDITYLIASVGVLGALLVGAGIFGILRARKRRPPAGKGGNRDDDGPGPTRGGDDGTPKDRARSGAVYGGAGGGVYGGGSPDGERPGAARSGPVYGGRAGGNGARPGGGGVYGGGGRAGEAGPGSGGRPGGGRPAGGGGGGVYGGGARSGGPPPAGGRAEPPRGGARVEPPRGGGRAEPPRGGGRAEPPRGDARAEPPRGGGPAQPPRGGGRAEPPRRGGGPAENDYRGRRSGRYREDNSEPYGQPPGGSYGYRGDRY